MQYDPRVRTQLDLPLSKKRRVQQWAATQDKSLTQIFNEALDEYFERHAVPEVD